MASSPDQPAPFRQAKHYDESRPHRSLGPGVPDPPEQTLMVPKSESWHRLATGTLALAKSVPGGLHHEYPLSATPAIA
jgi:hypothetical protein